MAFQILINILIAAIWMFLQNNYTFTSFFVGYIVGITVLFFIRRFLTDDFYMRRLWAFIKLVILFLKELVKANVDVAKIVLRPRINHNPAIIAVETQLDTRLEISILAALISLTPGTISMDFSDDSKTIFIHTIHFEDRKEMEEQIRTTFEKAIMEVTK